jgi:hypothetical protein
MMKTSKTSNNRRIVVIALLAATIIVTVGIAVLPASSIVKPAYAQLDDDISREQVVGGEEIEIPDSDDIKEEVGEITSSQSVPTLPEQATLLGPLRIPPALAG